MKTSTLCLALACVASAQGDARESRTVQTAQGPVRGYKTEDDVFDFYGIPYATAPTGPNRFTAPLPGPVWMHTFEATRKGIICPQPKVLMIDFSPYTMQEDCLVANVHMPDTEETNLPVMVYVHGGAYNLGFGSAITTHSLVKSKKIVGVTFNYRLGAHGFLCLGTEGAPGNAGMKDQVALLLWVKKNIANFGGNPDDVTIVGSSAGSSAVDLLMLSETTAGLYHKVIPESGANVGVWSMQLDPIETAKEFAKAHNFTELNNIYALEEFFKNAPYDMFFSSLEWLAREDSTFGFVPCIERNLGAETFLEDTPVNILKRGKYRKVPVLNGYANMEGLLRIGQYPDWKDAMNERFSDFLPADLMFKSDKEREEVAQKVRNFYFGDQPIGEETILGYVDYFSDILFAYPHLRSVDLQVAAGSDSIYLYEYSYFSQSSETNEMPEYMKKIKGASHGKQGIAVHEMDGDRDESEEYLKVKEYLRELWLNFIITGKPVAEGSMLPAWPPVGPNRSPHMDLGAKMTLKGPLLEKRARFWDDIYEQYYKSPVPPNPAVLRSEL